MNRMGDEPVHHGTDSRGSKLALLGRSAIVGVCVGVVVAGYRWLLEVIEGGVSWAYAGLRAHWAWIPLWVAGMVVLGLGLGFLGKKFPMIGGSGIPQVVGIIKGYFHDSWLGTLIAKFIGGAGAMLGGLALGREGPCIQMGASIGAGVGRGLAHDHTERTTLIAAGASAGMSAAFGAPLAGVLFVFEEIFHYLSPVTLLSTAVAAVGSDFVMTWVLGTDPVLDFPQSAALPLQSYWILVILGIVLGCVGALYNKTLMSVSTWYGQMMSRIRVARPVPVLLVGTIVGLAFPVALSGGHASLNAISMQTALGFLGVLLVVRFLFSIISFSSGAPGGILFPLLVIGALVGGIVGQISVRWLGIPESTLTGFVIVAMAGCFAAIVRAPITGIVLLLEMTGSFVHFLPLTLVSVVAYATAEMLGSPPIYSSLLKTQLAAQGLEIDHSVHGRRMNVETVVHVGAPGIGVPIRDLGLPTNALIVAIVRDGREIVPDGGTSVAAGDSLVIVIDEGRETTLREFISQTFESEPPTGSGVR